MKKGPQVEKERQRLEDLFKHISPLKCKIVCEANQMNKMKEYPGMGAKVKNK